MKNLRQIKATICALGVKNATVKKWYTSQKCVEANPNQIQLSTINRITFAKKRTHQSKHLQHRRWECFILKNKHLACLRHGNISQQILAK